MKYYRIGSFVLLVIAFSHATGQVLFTEPRSAGEKEIAIFMQARTKHVAGGKMSMWDIQNGLSWCYALFFAFLGSLNLYLSRTIERPKLKTLGLMNAVALFAGAIISIIYFFWLPVLSFAAAGACFLISALQLQRQSA